MADQNNGEQAIDAMKKIVTADVTTLESAGQLLDPRTDADLIEQLGQVAARYNSLFEIVAQGVRYGVMSFDRIPKAGAA